MQPPNSPLQDYYTTSSLTSLFRATSTTPRTQSLNNILSLTSHVRFPDPEEILLSRKICNHDPHGCQLSCSSTTSVTNPRYLMEKFWDITEYTVSLYGRKPSMCNSTPQKIFIMSTELRSTLSLCRTNKYFVNSDGRI